MGELLAGFSLVCFFIAGCILEIETKSIWMKKREGYKETDKLRGERRACHGSMRRDGQDLGWISFPVPHHWTTAPHTFIHDLQCGGQPLLSFL
ncbi:hypothetical protein BDV41DRAFT_526121 [Aspergillus transmontanensis]|uniref:Uncharacterized protein n=1 Tax=Aspergillus transmontanensis TaxID=1034304 RepID=A0A5N6W9V1_9EURO|nr:hypothetical protein BDV41DRAFT_526121 [Aspergillus transmontanensis]